jgi:hypothetical protein
MSGGPSRRRREGRNAFYRGGNPMDHNPYSLTDSDATDWLVGWNEAKREDEAAIAREAQAEIDDYDKVQEFARLFHLAKEQGLIE